MLEQSAQSVNFAFEFGDFGSRLVFGILEFALQAFHLHTRCIVFLFKSKFERVVGNLHTLRLEFIEFTVKAFVLKLQSLLARRAKFGLFFGFQCLFSLAPGVGAFSITATGRLPQPQ